MQNIYFYLNVYNMKGKGGYQEDGGGGGVREERNLEIECCTFLCLTYDFFYIYIFYLNIYMYGRKVNENFVGGRSGQEDVVRVVGRVDMSKIQWYVGMKML